MRCPKCGSKAKFIGFQDVPKKVRPQFGGKNQVRLYQCPKCGSFVRPGAYKGKAQ